MNRLFSRLLCAVSEHREASWSGHDTCTQSSTCLRCGTLLQRMAHVWSEWTPSGTTPCQHIKRCQRCGDSIEQLMHHWTPHSATHHHCSQCGEQRGHEPAPDRDRRRCKACGTDLSSWNP